MKKIEKEIFELLKEYERPKRVALSKKYPILKEPIIFLRATIRFSKDSLNSKIKFKKIENFFECVVARHQSLLKRKLGNSKPILQKRKITNLKQAIKQLNGVVIEPGDIFSFWNIVGKPKQSKGYVEGMLLSSGKIIEGVGGGLCQLSNLLYWLFLHAPVEIVERYHHSMDVFPDSNRTLPFGSGATILYNFIDLKLKNTSKYPLQIKLWLTEKNLKGQILSPKRINKKFHVFEKNHYLIKQGKKYFRYNEIYREVKIKGKLRKREKIAVNFAPVLYKVTEEYIKENNFEVLDFTNK